MKLLAIPKAEVDIIAPDNSIKTFVYFLGESYPSKEMAEYIQAIGSQTAKKKVRVFAPLIELTSEEYLNRKSELERFRKLSGGLNIVPKEDIILDNYKFQGCRIKECTEMENGNYSCSIEYEAIKN